MGKPIACTTPAAFSATPTKGSAAKNVGSLVNTTDDGFKTIGLQAMRIDNGGEPVDCVIKRIVIRTETAVSLIGNIGDAAKRIGDAAIEDPR